MSSSALAGVTVVDLTRGEAGAAASFALAQLGGTVILVEPLTGALFRAEAEALPNGEIVWSAWHANQRSFSVDLDAQAGRELACALVQTADILIEDSAEEMRRLGLDFECALRINPALVYGSLRSWTSEPAFRSLAGEIMLQAVSGVMAQTGESDGPPLRSGPHYVAGLSGLYLALGVMAALLDAKRTRVGEHVHVVEQEVGMSTAPGKYRTGAVFEPRTRYGNGVPEGAGTPSDVFATQPFGPGDWCHIHLNARSNSHWASLARALGREDLITDPDFATTEARKEHVSAINEMVTTWMAQRTKDEAMAILGAGGIPIGAVRTTAEILEIDHILASGMLSPVDGNGGPALVAGWPLRLSASRVPIQRGPHLGEHTDEVLARLGRADEAPSLRRQGVIR